MNAASAVPSSQSAVRWRYERPVLAFLVVAVVTVGVLSVVRQTCLSRRMGDLGCFLRGAWAIREGGSDLYRITDNNGWHYAYPPALAIVILPLADPPTGVQASWVLPYSASAVLWFVANVFCLAWGLHALARALEPATAYRSGRWWALRLLPLLACVAPVIGTATKGQVNIFLLALLCGWLAAMLRGQSFRAGAFLGAAVCLKIIPAFLLLVPLVRRDLRQLQGCAAALVVGLVLLPVIAIGPEKTYQLYDELVREVILAATRQDPNAVRAQELTTVNATDSQSFLTALHNILHPDRLTRPRVASPEVRLAHWALSGLMTGITLLAFGRRRGLPPHVHLVLFGGALMQTMILTSPVCHLHYFCLSIPLFMGLVSLGLESGPRWGKRLPLLLSAYALALASPSLIPIALFRDFGLASLLTLLAWGSACTLAFRPARSAAEVAPPLARAA